VLLRLELILGVVALCVAPASAFVVHKLGSIRGCSSPTTSGRWIYTHSLQLRMPVAATATRSGEVPMVPYFPPKHDTFSGGDQREAYVWMDVFNALGRERQLFVHHYIDDHVCNQVIASLLWLQGYVIMLLCLWHGSFNCIR
jgi:hypothetical protein